MPTILSEQIDLSEAQIDSANRMLRNVVLIRAGTSQNRRHYSEAVLQKAAPLFEGVKSYDGHDNSRARTLAETTGWYANVRYENGALRADRHFSGTQAGKDVQSIAEDIVSGKAPKNLAGLSINAVGDGRMQKLPDGDALVVESITKAKSVDDVGNPAAGGGYIESVKGDELAIALLEAMTYEEFLEARPEFVERLRKDFKRVRQEEALKAAEAETQRIQDELKEAQQIAQTHLAERETARSERDTAQRALLVEQALNAVTLPASWKDDLRKTLTEAAPSEWAAVIQRERQKAESAGIKARVNVTGSGQQINTPIPMRENTSPLPAPDEGLGGWIERISHANTNNQKR